MKKRVLFYYPSNKRSVAIETLLEELVKQGIDVSFLSHIERGKIHETLDKLGVKTYSTPIKKGNALIYYARQILFLIQFTRKHKIKFVFSNLQQANLIGVIAQYFMSAKVICFRHHFKFFSKSQQKSAVVNKNEKFGDRLINLLARKIVVPSSGVYNGMLNQENVRESKLSIIPYIYDFAQYGKPDTDAVEEIKKATPAKLRLIMVSRLIPLKRHIIVLPLVKELLSENLNLHLYILDEGPEKERIESYIREHGLTEAVTMLGFRTDFLDYMAASDLIIHPSITEASNSAVKEMALLSKSAIVCKKVGDFDDYILHRINGYLCDIDEFAKEAKEIIQELYNDPKHISQLGENLNQTVLEKFSVNEETMDKYLNLLQES
ncbi:MAG: glycosyltransferase family 4 protein [Bacteroidota bacterium]